MSINKHHQRMKIMTMAAAAKCNLSKDEIFKNSYYSETRATECAAAREIARLMSLFSITKIRLTIWQFLSRSSSTDWWFSRMSDISSSRFFSCSSNDWIREFLSFNRQFFSSSSRRQSLMTSVSEFVWLRLLSALSGELDSSPIDSDGNSLPNCKNTMSNRWKI